MLGMFSKRVEEVQHNGGTQRSGLSCVGKCLGIWTSAVRPPHGKSVRAIWSAIYTCSMQYLLPGGTVIP